MHSNIIDSYYDLTALVLSVVKPDDLLTRDQRIKNWKRKNKILELIYIKMKRD